MKKDSKKLNKEQLGQLIIDIYRYVHDNEIYENENHYRELLSDLFADFLKTEQDEEKTKPLYLCVKDLQSTNFAVGRCEKPEGWLRLAMEWALNENYFQFTIADFMKNWKHGDDWFIEGIGEVWDIEIKKLEFLIE